MKNKLHQCMLFVALLVLFLGSITSATQGQNVTGTTGLINIPTASVKASGTANLSYNWFGKQHYASMLIGALPGVEVGLMGKLDSSTNLGLVGNIKVKLLEETIDYPALALGLRVDGGKASYYVVGSMQIGMPGVRGHAGIGTGVYSRPFVGISSVLNPVAITSADKQFSMPLTTLTMEFDGRLLNAGLVLKFNNQLEGKITISNFESIGLGLNYTYSF